MSSDKKLPLALIIVDGLEMADANGERIAEKANMPYYEGISDRYPRAVLKAEGETLGFTAGKSGNAEIGHMTIGAGRAVRTDAAEIDRMIETGEFFENQVLKEAFETAAARGAAVHFIGLLSDGGVHSNSEHLYALLRMAKQNGIKNGFVHAILDGRDVPQRTADIYVEALEIKMADIGLGTIASVCGRYYAMDSSLGWERTARAFTMLTHAEGERAADPAEAIRASFLRGISDEFVAPVVIGSEDKPAGVLTDGDLVIFFNHRGDGLRQLVQAVSVPDGKSSKPVVETVCLVEYEPGFGLPAAFDGRSSGDSLSEVFAEQRVSNYRVTQTERIPHLTTLFDAAAREQSDLETLLFVTDPGPLTAEAEPESLSFKIADRLMEAAGYDTSGVFIANLPAIALSAGTGREREAAEYVDTCLGGMVEAILDLGGTVLVTSSFAGNAEGTVPLYMIGGKALPKLAAEGTLADIAPTMLDMMGIRKPGAMTGNSLLV